MPRTQFLKALAVQEAAYQGFTHMAIIRAGIEVTESVVAAAQTFKLGTQRLGEVIRRSVVSMPQGFQDLSDAAFNTTALTVKTLTSAGADKTVLHTALELNVNGTEITGDQVNNTPSPAAALGDTVVAVLASMAAKKLSDLDRGCVLIFFEIVAPVQLAENVSVQPTLPGGLTVEQKAVLTLKSIEEVLKEEEEEAAKARGESGEDAVNYDEMTVAELKDLARKRGVEIPSDARKDEIIEALEEEEPAKA
jgi:hypothetical protein